MTKDYYRTTALKRAKALRVQTHCAATTGNSSMSLHGKHCPCGYVGKSSKGFSNHRRYCQTYKDALNRGNTQLMPRGPIDRSRFTQAPTQVISHVVQEDPGPSHQAEEPYDIQMVRSAFLYHFHFNLIYN